MNPTVRRLEEIKPVVRHMADDYETTTAEEVENLRVSLTSILRELELEPTFVVLAERVRRALDEVDILLEMLDCKPEPVEPADDLTPIFFHQFLMNAHRDLTADE